MGHARVLAGVEKIDHQLFLFQSIVKQGWSVRETERQSKLIEHKGTPRKKANPNISDDLKRVQDQLASYLETKVLIKPKGKNKGSITFEYFSNDDLDRLIQLIEK